MIDDRQMRAARAMLNWTQDQLAAASGIARATIRNIEAGDTLPRLETTAALRAAFENAGVEFLPGSGVRMRDRIVHTFEGNDAPRMLIEDIYATLAGQGGGEFLVAHLDEGDSIKNLSMEFIEEQIKKRRAANITQRMLVRADDPHLIPPFDSYRVLPAAYFSAYPLYVYGTKLALLSWQPAPRVVVIDDMRFADSARMLFNFIWERTQMPPYHGKA